LVVQPIRWNVISQNPGDYQHLLTIITPQILA